MYNQIILTPVNAEFPSKTNNEEDSGRKYTWSPVSNHMAADTDAPLYRGSPPEYARVS